MKLIVCALPEPNSGHAMATENIRADNRLMGAFSQWLLPAMGAGSVS